MTDGGLSVKGLYTYGCGYRIKVKFDFNKNVRLVYNDVREGTKSRDKEILLFKLLLFLEE